MMINMEGGRGAIRNPIVQKCISGKNGDCPRRPRPRCTSEARGSWYGGRRPKSYNVKTKATVARLQLTRQLPAGTVRLGADGNSVLSRRRRRRRRRRKEEKRETRIAWRKSAPAPGQHTISSQLFTTRVH